MKRTVTLLTAAILVFSVCSCGKKDTDTMLTSETVLLPTEEYVMDNTPTELCAAVNAALPISSELSAPDPSYIMSVYDSVAEKLEAFSVLMDASGMTVNEYGIIKADADENTETVKSAVRDYLDARLAEVTEYYAPEEKAKIENASINVYGRYIVYCILSEDHTALVNDAVKDVLTAKENETAA